MSNIVNNYQDFDENGIFLNAQTCQGGITWIPHQYSRYGNCKKQCMDPIARFTLKHFTAGLLLLVTQVRHEHNKLLTLCHKIHVS